MPPKTSKDRAPLVPVSFRFDQQTLDDLDKIAASVGLSNRTEAIRYLARQAVKTLEPKRK